MGDYNSVLNVEPKHKTEPFLFVDGNNHGKQEHEFGFIYLNPGSDKSITNENIIALLNNKRIPDQDIKISGNKINLLLNNSVVHGMKRLRIAVCQDGQVTNIQNILLFNGNPAGSDKKHFTWHDAVIYSAMIDRFNDGDKQLDKPIVHDSLLKRRIIWEEISRA